MQKRVRGRALLVRTSIGATGAAAALALAACGGGDDAASASDQQERFEKAQLQFARCMRAHGVDMPDPKPGGRGTFSIRARGSRDASRRTLDAAQRSCERYLRGVGPGKITREDRVKLQDAAVKTARCMRAHGIDMPDPEFGGGPRGGGIVKQRLGRGIRPDSKKFQDAMKACEHFMRDAGMKFGPGPGPRP
jgi:hypothetical protein